MKPNLDPSVHLTVLRLNKKDQASIDKQFADLIADLKSSYGGVCTFPEIQTFFFEFPFPSLNSPNFLF